MRLYDFDFKDERHQYNYGVRVMSDRILLYTKENPATYGKILFIIFRLIKS
jgi:hypothetical protein